MRAKAAGVPIRRQNAAASNGQQQEQGCQVGRSGYVGTLGTLDRIVRDVSPGLDVRLLPIWALGNQGRMSRFQATRLPSVIVEGGGERDARGRLPWSIRRRPTSGKDSLNRAMSATSAIPRTTPISIQGDSDPHIGSQVFNLYK